MDRRDEILLELRSIGTPEIERSAIERIFQLPRRSAIRLLQDFGATGKSKLKIDRKILIERVQEYDCELTGEQEVRRRAAFEQRMEKIRQEFIEQPPILVTAPVAIQRTKIRQLREHGIVLEPGRIEIQFQTPEEAMKKLVLLGQAMSNELSEFEDAVRMPEFCEVGS